MQLPSRSSLIENPAQRRDLDGQIRILDDRPSPDGGHDLFFQDELTGPFDQYGKNIESPRADRCRNEDSPFILLGQTLAPIEAKVLELENLGRGEHALPPRLSRGSELLRR